MKVQVYWNYHKKMWSVVAREGYNKGRVVSYADKVLIEDAKFVVQPAGNAKVRRDKKKNVHAFVRGTLTHLIQDEINAFSMRDNAWLSALNRGETRQVKYNPYKYEQFVFADDEEPVFFAKSVALLGPRNLVAKI